MAGLQKAWAYEIRSSKINNIKSFKIRGIILPAVNGFSLAPDGD